MVKCRVLSLRELLRIKRLGTCCGLWRAVLSNASLRNFTISVF